MPRGQGVGHPREVGVDVYRHLTAHVGVGDVVAEVHRVAAHGESRRADDVHVFIFARVPGLVRHLVGVELLVLVIRDPDGRPIRPDPQASRLCPASRAKLWLARYRGPATCASASRVWPPKRNRPATTRVMVRASSAACMARFCPRPMRAVAARPGNSHRPTMAVWGARSLTASPPVRWE